MPVSIINQYLLRNEVDWRGNLHIMIGVSLAIGQSCAHFGQIYLYFVVRPLLKLLISSSTQKFPVY